MSLYSALTELRQALAEERLPLPLPGVTHADASRAGIVRQLDDYVLPRLASLDAPLLAVIGGSTGSGKSTILNSLVGARVAAASAIRPTTRRPLLLHHPGDEDWFSDDRVLGALARVRRDPASPPTPAGEGSHSEVEVRSAPIPEGLALLDAPDIDSVAEDNRELAAHLLAAADLWVFVTTAARYADAVPWEFLAGAARRNAAVAVVLNRVPPADAETVASDLRSRLDAAGLGGAPIFVMPEGPLQDGLIPSDVVAPLRSYLAGLAGDAATRAAVARQTLEGAVDDLLREGETVRQAGDGQREAATALGAAIGQAVEDAGERVRAATRDGSLLRGEVLSRWQELIGTGEFLKNLEATVGRFRDRIGAFFRGTKPPAEEVGTAVEDSLQVLLASEARRAATDVERAWRGDIGLRDLAADGAANLPQETALLSESATHVVAWQNDLLQMVRTEGSGKRTTARALSLGVNGLGVILMVVVLASTGGVITGAEIAAAGGTAVVGQRLLEAVFGEDAVRRMASRSRDGLVEHGREVTGWYLTPFSHLRERLRLGSEGRIAAALEGARQARKEQS